MHGSSINNVILSLRLSSHFSHTFTYVTDVQYSCSYIVHVTIQHFTSVRYNTAVHQRGCIGEVLRVGETAFSRLLLYSLYFDTKCTIQTVAVVVVALGSRLQCSTVCLTRHLMVGAICDEHKKQQRPVIIHFINTVNGDTLLSR